MATMRTRGACPSAPDRILPRGTDNADSAAGMSDFRKRRRPCPSRALLVSSLAVASLSPVAVVGVAGWVPSAAWHSSNVQHASSTALEPAHSTLARRIQLRDSLLSSSTTTLFAEDSTNQRRNLENDISKRLSIAGDRSQLQPPESGSKRSGNQAPKSKRWRASFKRSGPRGSSDRNSSSTTIRSQYPVISGDSETESSPPRPRQKESLQHNPRKSSEASVVASRRRRHQNQRSMAGSKINGAVNRSSPFSSLLPPPLKSSTINENDGKDDPLSSGLSSWEEFLGVGLAEASTDATPSSVVTSPPSQVPLEELQFLKSPPPLLAFARGGTKAQASKKQKKQRSNPILSSDSGPMTKSILDAIPRPEALPSIQDLFPPDPSQNASTSESNPQTIGKTMSQSSSMDSASSSKATSLDGVVPVSDLFYRSSPNGNDDVLPNMSELLSKRSSDNSKQASSSRQKFSTRQPGVTKQQQQTQDMIAKKTLAKKKSGRKMIRRGMEMLVGGVPINADPPQRCVELTYDDSTLGSTKPDWARTISLSTLDFGPLLHTPSIPQVTAVERGLYCEYFCHSALKWDVCPKDLRDVVRAHTRQYLGDSARPNRVTATRPTAEPMPSASDEDVVPPTHDEEDDEYNEIMAIQVRESPPNSLTSLSNERTSTRKKSLPKAKGFGKANGDAASTEDRQFYVAVTEISFNLTVSVADLEEGDGDEKYESFKYVLAGAFKFVTVDDSHGFTVDVSKLILTDKGNGTTNVDVEYKLSNERAMTLAQVQKRLKGISASFLQAVDDDALMVAMAGFAKFQARWPPDVRERVSDACLQEEADGADEMPDELILPSAALSVDESQRSLKNGNRRSRDELYIGGGVDGVFPNYSEANTFNAPFRGELGLRLVDAVTQRAKERVPRVIAIGDVHGCIDELQDLLRQCDYRPGDLVVFLGDLICKGPDSISVVQMAREIGAIGVRGNHDFEVIRWHQAIRSGVDPPVVGSEHFHIASCLTKADMKWLYRLPWYMSSKELGALFVHAGFVSGIRLAKQNPRLMMNMRSILPDGTVTSKFFNNWPWARLWDGPQTVLFGHDADRGLQLYEHAIGLDTGCVYGGRLTACILPEKKLVSVSARREYFKYRRKHYD